MNIGLRAFSQPDGPADSLESGRKRWRPAFTTWLLSLLVLIGTGTALYPSTSQWLTSYNQSTIIGNYSTQIAESDPDASTQLLQAQRYNDALTSGVDILAGTAVPAGSGTSSNASLEYENILNANDEGLMARIKFPAASVDLPVYHGTSDAILMQGSGHLEGSHLPIGGESTRSVITAHRGLATATMFNHLDQVGTGDRFTIEVFGEVLTYEVRDVVVVKPDETNSLRAEQGRDLVTLVTCTPLGINTHRILVTGERVTPTPIRDIENAGRASTIPGFPWWALGLGAGLTLVAGLVWRAGFTDAESSRARSPETP